MILFRIKPPGDADWSEISIDGELAAELHSIVGAALDSSAFIVQVFNPDEEEWEDLS